jgi:hypothetical protein
MVEIVHHRLRDVAWHLRSARTVEVRDRQPVLPPFECGKTGADLVN